MIEWRSDDVETYVVAPIDRSTIAAAHAAASARSRALCGSTSDIAKVLDALLDTPAAGGATGDVVAVAG